MKLIIMKVLQLLFVVRIEDEVVNPVTSKMANQNADRNPSTFNLITSMVSTFIRQEKFSDAEVLFKQCLDK